MDIEDQGMVEHLILIAEEYEAEASRLESQRQVEPIRPEPRNPLPDS